MKVKNSLVGRISRFYANNKIEVDTIKGLGQSGGTVYHYVTKRVIGLAIAGFKPDIIMNAGLATCFKPLFGKWPELETINNKVAQSWDEHLENFLKSS